MNKSVSFNIAAIAILITVMYFFPPVLTSVIFISFLFMRVIKGIVVYVRDAKVIQPWLSVSNSPEFTPVKDVEGRNPTENWIEKTAYGFVEGTMLKTDLVFEYITLALFIYFVIGMVENPKIEIVAIAFFTLLMLPLTYVQHEKVRHFKEMENPFGIKGIYRGKKTMEITPESLFTTKPSRTYYECTVAEIEVDGILYDAIFDDEELLELIPEGEPVYVYSRLGYPNKEQGRVVEKEIKKEEDQEEDLEKDLGKTHNIKNS